MEESSWKLLSFVVATYLTQDRFGLLRGQEIRATMQGALAEKQALLDRLCLDAYLIKVGAPPDDDVYGPTPAGLLDSSTGPDVRVVLEALFATLKRKHAKEGTFRAFSFNELAPGIAFQIPPSLPEEFVHRIFVVFQATYPTDRFDGSIAWVRPARTEELVELRDAETFVQVLCARVRASQGNGKVRQRRRPARATAGKDSTANRTPSKREGLTPRREPTGPSHGRHDFPASTIRTLGERVGLLCSNPGCGALTKAAHTNNSKAANVGKACHIHAASRGGPRYDPNQTKEQRQSIDNGIWLCSNCSTLIDNDEGPFPPTLLRQWKAKAETATRERIGKPDRVADGGSDGIPPWLSAISIGEELTLWYVPLGRRPGGQPHRVTIRWDGVDRLEGVVNFTGLSMANGPHSVPIADIHQAGRAKGKREIRVNGYFDRLSDAEGFRYVSNGPP